MTLFGSYDLIWSAAREAAGRGSPLVTLSPNRSFDSQRWDRQSKGEAIHSSGTDCPARQLSLFNLSYTDDQEGYLGCMLGK